MNKKMSLFVFIMIISLCFSGFEKEVHAESNPLQFNDLSSVRWAWDSIYYLAGKEMINGYGKGKFGPNDAVTRGQAAAILVRELYPGATSTSASPFSDIYAGHPFYQEILIAAEKGIFEGYPDQTYKPNEPITRAAAAKILAIAYNIGTGNTSAKFNDLNQAPWATTYISSLSSNQIITGYGDGSFKPNAKVSRAEFSKMLATTLVHQDPSIWVTPVPGSANGYLPIRGKSYEYSSGDGNHGYIMHFKEINDEGQPVWTSKNNDGTTDEHVYDESTDYVGIMVDKEHEIISLEFSIPIAYPIFVGKTWDELWEILGISEEPAYLKTVSSINETIVTSAGTFQNVVEVKDNHGGLTYYIARGIGTIMIKDGPNVLLELTSIN